MFNLFNLFKTQTPKQTQDSENLDLPDLDLDNALFSIGVDSIESCRGIAIKLFDQGVSCLDDLRSVSEQDARGILSSACLNKIQENKIISAIQGLHCQIVEPPKVPHFVEPPKVPEPPKIQQSVERRFISLDCSYSVKGEFNYFEYLSRLIDSKSPKNSIYCRWDTSSKIYSLDEIKDWINSKKGYGGTNPICFIKDIPEDFGPNDTLIIVSDGQIVSQTAQSFCKEMNARFPFGHKFKQIQVILIDTGGPIDYSIVSAFTKYNCPFKLEIYERNGSLKSTEEENYFKLFDKLRDMENLSDMTPELRKSIHNLALGCSSTDRIVVELRSEITRLMRKFQEELDKAPQGGNPTLDEFIAETRKVNPSIAVLERCVKKLTSKFHLEKATSGNPLMIFIQTISDLTHRLLDFEINSGLHNSGNGVSGLAVVNASVVKVEEIDTGAMEEECDYEDPIFGGLSVVLVPIAQGDSLLPSGNLSDMRKFPMKLGVNDGIFMAPIGLDGFIGIVQHSLSSGLNLSHPLTRAPMRNVGFLIFPARATDEQKASIVKFNNYAIAKLLFNGKKVGDPNLFYFCFALRMLSVSFLQEHKPQIEEEIRWRLNNSMTFATLCGPSTEFPHDKMSILNALIFTVLSACVCETSAQNPLLMHISYLSKIKKLLKISGLKLPVEINKHLNLIQDAMKLLSVNKDDQTNNKGKMRLLGYRNLIGWKLITVDGSFYPTGVRLNEEEQLEQNEIFKGILQEIVGFPIEIDLFCSLYDLSINQNDFLKLPHIPFGLPIVACPWNFTLFKSTDRNFRIEVVNQVKSKGFKNLPSFEYMCSRIYTENPKQLLTIEVWDELVANQLDTNEKFIAFCQEYDILRLARSNETTTYSSGTTWKYIPRQHSRTTIGRSHWRQFKNQCKKSM